MCHKQGFPIEALAPALAPPTRLGLQESSLATPLVYVAAGPQEIGLWDVEQGKCHQARELHLTGSLVCGCWAKCLVHMLILGKRNLWLSVDTVDTLG